MASEELQPIVGLLFLFLWRTRRACEIAGRRPRLGLLPLLQRLLKSCNVRTFGGPATSGRIIPCGTFG